MSRAGFTPKGGASAKFAKNYLINADMDIAQRGTSFPAIAGGSYSLDRYAYDKNGAMVHTISQSSDVPTLAQASYAFKNSLLVTLTTPDTSLAAGDYCTIQQRVEGFNYANLHGKTITLSFWVKATLPGIYCIGFVNGTPNRSYVTEYTINAANTWEKKTITITTDTVGSWNLTNGLGLRIVWTIAAGTTYQTTANSWQNNFTFATANQVNGVNTGATAFSITGVMLNEGDFAAPFRLFGEDAEGELAACQRYYEKNTDLTVYPGQNIGLAAGVVGFGTGNSNVVNQYQRLGQIFFRVQKRATPTAFCWSPSGVQNTGFAGDGGSILAAGSCTPQQEGPTGFNVTSTPGGYSTNFYTVFFHWTASAEL
jgi:hypothetical protein